MRVGWLEFWITALACYRITVLISRCLGPWGVFKSLRAIDRCSKLLKCPFCVSIYIGGFCSFCLWLSGYSEPFAIWFFLSLAFSGVTIVLDRTFTADHNP
jgi:hypothetical protein